MGRRRGIGRLTYLSSVLLVDDVMLDGPARRRGPTRHADLRVDVLDVVLGGSRRDEQLRRDLAAGAAIGQESQHFDLAPAQAAGTLEARPRARVAQRCAELLAGVDGRV